MPTSAPLEGEQVMPKVTAEVIPQFEQPTVLAPTLTCPITTFDDNPIVDHLGDNFEHPPPDQGRPRHICTESVAIRRLHTGEGVISNLPHERGELPRGIQEGDEAAQMANWMANENLLI